MDKCLYLHFRQLTVDISHLAERELAGHHDAHHSKRGQLGGAARVAYVGLSAGMKGNGRQIHCRDTHILDYQRIGPGMMERPYHALHIGGLRVVDESVEGHIHARPEAVGRSSHLGYVGHRTGCGGTGAMSWSADIHCVGAMGYGGESRGFVARRSEEFEFYCHIFGKISQNTP